MKLAAARDIYYYATGQVSQITRQLSLAGIAVVWLFKAGDGTSFSLPDGLALALVAFIAALLIDLLQYVVTAIIWGSYSWCKEWQFLRADIDPASDKPESDFRPSDFINFPALALLAVKCLALGTGGWFLLHYLWDAQMPGVI